MEKETEDEGIKKEQKEDTSNKKSKEMKKGRKRQSNHRFLSQ